MAAWAEDLGEAAVEQEALLVATGMDCSMAGVGMGAVMKEKMAMMGEEKETMVEKTGVVPAVAVMELAVVVRVKGVITERVAVATEVAKTEVVAMGAALEVAVGLAKAAGAAWEAVTTEDGTAAAMEVWEVLTEERRIQANEGGRVEEAGVAAEVWVAAGRAEATPEEEAMVWVGAEREMEVEETATAAAVRV
ncbi:hypothetical protein AB1Y20_017693 [Prymnesium parvum]|uniref:Uncharacterized protein n=1 Tax=Prymnesium parvum TaxID=97485 RepID=A0AB34JP68_PRYPA